MVLLFFTILISLLSVRAELSEIGPNATSDIQSNRDGTHLRRTSRQMDCTLSEKRTGIRGFSRNTQRVAGVDSEDACTSACWQQKTQGSPCYAANYYHLSRNCEMILGSIAPQIFYTDYNTVYLRPAFCRDRSVPIQSDFAQSGFTYPSQQTQSSGGTTNIRAGSCGQTSVSPSVNLRSLLSKKSPGLRIVGGTEAVKHSIPFIVSMRKGGQHFCGGALVRPSPRHESTDIIVTAAHCVKEDGGFSSFDVVAGAHDLRRPEFGQETVRALRSVPHPNYDDRTVVKLSRAIPFSRTIQPVCLPESGEDITDGMNGLVTGWGTVREGNRQTSWQLRQVVIPVINGQTCKKAYSKDEILLNSMVCGGYPQGGKDACQGDSGGPYVFVGRNGFTLQGIVSWGEGCARRGNPGVYTRVTNFVPWIEAQIRALSSIR